MSPFLMSLGASTLICLSCTWMIGRFYHGGSFDEGVLVRVDGPVEDLNSEFSDKRYHTPRVEFRVKASA